MKLYEILGIDPKATPDQLERAYRFCLEMYSDSGLATYSLLEAPELDQIRSRIESAYRILKDPVLRRRYDAGEDLRAVPPPSSPPARPAHRGPVQTLPDPVTGADLRRFREAQGISLRDIAAESKIGVRFFEYIEADRHSFLPAEVYLRSFLVEYARAIGLEPRKTAESYMGRILRET